MASSGITKISAVNRMLRAINELPITVLDTGGASIAARAEEVLEERRLSILTRGWDQENVHRAKQITPNGSGEFILDTSIIKIRGTGPNEHRSFTIRDTKVFDLNRYTSTLTGDASLFIDAVYDVAFDQLSPTMKEFIASEATEVFQRRWRGSPDQDGYLQQERARDEAQAAPLKARMAPPELNTVPVAIGQQQGQRNQ